MKTPHEHDSNFGGLGPALGPALKPDPKPENEKYKRRKAEEQRITPHIIADEDGRWRTVQPDPSRWWPFPMGHFAE